MSIFNSSLIILMLILYLIIEIKYGVKAYKGFKKWKDKRFLVLILVFLVSFVITAIIIGEEILRLLNY